jgi:hypothetical protein
MHVDVSGYGPHRGLQVRVDGQAIGELKFPVFRPRGTIWLGGHQYEVRSKIGIFGTAFRLERAGQVVVDGNANGEIRFGDRLYKMKSRDLISRGPPDVYHVTDAASGEMIGSIEIADNAAKSDFLDETDSRLVLFLLWVAGRASQPRIEF